MLVQGAGGTNLLAVMVIAGNHPASGRGAEAMSDDIEGVQQYGEQSCPWTVDRVSYGTERSLGGYVEDLDRRLGFFDKWIEQESTCDILALWIFLHSCVLTVSEC